MNLARQLMATRRVAKGCTNRVRFAIVSATFLEEEKLLRREKRIRMITTFACNRHRNIRLALLDKRRSRERRRDESRRKPDPA